MEPRGLEQWQCSINLKRKYRIVASAEHLKCLVGVDFNLRLSTALANERFRRQVRNSTVSSAQIIIYCVFIYYEALRIDGRNSFHSLLISVMCQYFCHNDNPSPPPAIHTR